MEKREKETGNQGMTLLFLVEWFVDSQIMFPWDRDVDVKNNKLSLIHVKGEAWMEIQVTSVYQ